MLSFTRRQLQIRSRPLCLWGPYQAIFANLLGATGGIVNGQQPHNDLQLLGVIAFYGRVTVNGETTDVLLQRASSRAFNRSPAV
ncbi:MAG: hypothetical protein J2P41_06540 [Blastocatellia bacterium]|nr:hypothetical protein [Blastocatellia bacterium]